eukprot:1153787-Pelagomonas_calceolata.AAC.2
MQILQQRLQIAAAAADAEAPAAGLDVEEQPQPQGQQQLGGPRASATMQGHQPLPIQKKRGRPPKQPQQQQPALGTHQAAPTRPPLPRKRKQQAAGTSKRSIRRAGAAVAEVVTAYAPEVQPAVLQAAVNRRDMAGARKIQKCYTFNDARFGAPSYTVKAAATALQHAKPKPGGQRAKVAARYNNALEVMAPSQQLLQEHRGQAYTLARLLQVPKKHVREAEQAAGFGAARGGCFLWQPTPATPSSVALPLPAASESSQEELGALFQAITKAF